MNQIDKSIVVTLLFVGAAAFVLGYGVLYLYPNTRVKFHMLLFGLGGLCLFLACGLWYHDLDLFPAP